MATGLDGKDLLVVQKTTGTQQNCKLSVSQLQSFIATGPVITFKDALDATNAAAEPPVEDRVAGNLYINNAAQPGNFAWTAGTDPYTGTVNPGAQVIWIADKGWGVTNNSSGDVGVEEIESVAPITVDNSEPAKPTIGVSAALTTVDADDNVTAQTSGVVTIATDADITLQTANRVTTAKQMAATRTLISEAGGGTVTSVSANPDGNPITVTDGSADAVISIADASSGAVGVVQLVDNGSYLAADTASDTDVVTQKYASSFFLISNFANLADVDDVENG